MNSTNDIEEILETILAREIQKELNKEIIHSIQTSEPMKSTPIMFECEAEKENFRRRFQKIVERKIPGDDDVLGTSK